ncbi:hypothetical protein KEM55_001462 [Ascosphaera atra]|nr:hypothetical protein KEM55_001462 [Ascosphaera atra]
MPHRHSREPTDPARSAEDTPIARIPRSRKTARFSTPNLRATESVRKKGPRFSLPGKTPSQKTLTQIDFVKCQRRARDVDVDVDVDFIGEEDGSRDGRQYGAAQRRRGPRRSTRGRPKDDTLTQIGFVKRTPSGANDDDDQRQCISPLRENAGRTSSRQSGLGEVELSEQQSSPEPESAPFDESLLEEPPRKRRRRATPGLHPSEDTANSDTFLVSDDVTREPQPPATPQHRKTNVVRSSQSPASSIDASPYSALGTLINYSPSRLVRNRGLVPSPFSKTPTRPRDASPTPRKANERLGNAMVSGYSSSAEGTESFASQLGMHGGASETPVTSPMPAQHRSGVPSSATPLRQSQDTQVKIEGAGSQSLAPSYARDLFGPVPRDDRVIPDSEDEDDLILELEDEEANPMNGNVVKEEQGMSQPQLYEMQPYVSSHPQARVEASQPVKEEHEETQSQDVSTDEPAPSALTTHAKESNWQSPEQLYEPSLENHTHSQPLQGMETQSLLLPIQSQVPLKASQSFTFGTRHDDLDETEGVNFSTQYVPSSAEDLNAGQKRQNKESAKGKELKMSPSSPPPILVESSQGQAVERARHSDDQTEKSQESLNELNGQASFPSVAQDTFQLFDTSKQLPSSDNDGVEESYIGNNQDSHAGRVPRTISQLLPSSLLSWPKALFELPGLVWNGDTHVRASQLPERERRELEARQRKR